VECRMKELLVGKARDSRRIRVSVIDRHSFDRRPFGYEIRVSAFGKQVFVDEFFRETQLSGISHLPTAPVRGFLNAAARLVERADTNPT